MSMVPYDIDRLPRDLTDAAAYQDVRSEESRREAALRWPLLRAVNRVLAVVPGRLPVDRSVVPEVSGRYDLRGGTAGRVHPERGPRPGESEQENRDRVEAALETARRTA